MGTFLGITIGIAATMLVARYYFNRTMNKRLSVFVTMNNRIFAGIDPQVRRQLEFKYNHENIERLQQIELIVANDGDKAIRDCIEPLRIEIAKPARLLDASILHRDPADLDVEISPHLNDNDKPIATCTFPLLNAGEFFLVKLLLDQHVDRHDITCRILCDDIPRKFKPQSLSTVSASSPKNMLGWCYIGLGGFTLLMPAALSVMAWNYYQIKPSIFPYPWSGFESSWIEISALAICAIGALVSCLFGICLICIGFVLKTQRFPLPDEHNGQMSRLGIIKELELLSREYMIRALADIRTDREENEDKESN